jgi:hypothetical protein
MIVKPVPGKGWRYYSDKEWYHHRECDVVFNELVTAAIWDAIATQNTTILKEVLAESKQEPPRSFFSASPGFLTFTFDDETIQHAGYNPEMHRKFLREYYTYNFPGTMSSVRLVYKEGINIFHAEMAGLSGYKKSSEQKDKEWVQWSFNRLELIQALTFLCGNYSELIDMPAYPAVNSKLWKLACSFASVFSSKIKTAEVQEIEDRNLLKLLIKQGAKRYYVWMNFSSTQKLIGDGVFLSRLAKLKKKDLAGRKVLFQDDKAVLEPYAFLLA